MLVKIASVLLSSVPLVVLFGSAYFLTGGSTCLKDAMLKIYCVLNRMPGTNMVSTYGFLLHIQEDGKQVNCWVA